MAHQPCSPGARIRYQSTDSIATTRSGSSPRPPHRSCHAPRDEPELVTRSVTATDSRRPGGPPSPPAGPASPGRLARAPGAIALRAPRTVIPTRETPMSVVPWTGVRRVAVVPVFNKQVEPPPPPDWAFQV